MKINQINSTKFVFTVFVKKHAVSYQETETFFKIKTFLRLIHFSKIIVRNMTFF